MQKSSSRAPSRATFARFGRFLIVGGTGVLIDFGTYFLLLNFGVDAALSKAISFILGSIWAYFANWKFTFGARMSKFTELAFAAVYLSALVVNTVVNSFTLEIAKSLEWKFLLAFLLATGASTVWNFVGMSLFVFRPKTEEESSP